MVPLPTPQRFCSQACYLRCWGGGSLTPNSSSTREQALPHYHHGLLQVSSREELSTTTGKGHGGSGQELVGIRTCQTHHKEVQTPMAPREGTEASLDSPPPLCTGTSA